METVITVLALAAQMEVSLYQVDVKLAFLNEELKEEVYVEKPFELHPEKKRKQSSVIKKGAIWVKASTMSLEQQN